MGATAVKTAVDLSLVPLGRGEKNDLLLAPALPVKRAANRRAR